MAVFDTVASPRSGPQPRERPPTLRGDAMTTTPETRADAPGGTGPTTGTALVSTLVLTTTTPGGTP